MSQLITDNILYAQTKSPSEPDACKSELLVKMSLSAISSPLLKEEISNII